jgi:hypothetical protein
MTTIRANIHDEVAKTVNKAKLEGLWFYCMGTKEWLTPEDFEQYAKVYLISHGESPDILINYVLSDPKEGIRIRIAYLKKASFELQEFSERVMSYFNFTGKTRQ